MIKTKIQKILAVAALAAMTTMNFSSVSASVIGTGSVTGSGAFDTNINWNDTFPGTASGSVSNIKIKARVNPSLNMSISAAEIDLGVLVPGVASSGSLTLEVGTNAKAGVSITARSQSGGLTNIADNAIQINNLTTDGVAESYTWQAAINGTADSAAIGYTATNGGTNGLDTAKQVNGIVIEHNVYTTNKAEATLGQDDVIFNVSATTTAETPAGDYADYVTFTVTGNF